MEKSMETPKAIIIASVILALALIVSPIALQAFKMSQCISAGIADSFCVSKINGAGK